MKKILYILAIWFVILQSINIISAKFIFDKTSYELPKNLSVSPRHIFVPWLNFDGRNYLEIAQNGYTRNFKLDLRVFFPLYPVLARVLSLNLVINPILVGLGISILALLGSVIVFNKLLIQEKVGEKNRFKILLLLFLFPTSFYLLSFYTESLFLLLVLLSFYFMNRKNFVAASIFAGFATATRVTGLTLLPPLFFIAYQYYKKHKKFPWSTLVSPLGLIFYFLYIQLTTGRAMSIIDKQKDWNKPIGMLGPWYAIRDGFLKFIYGSSITRGDFFGRSMEIIEFISLIFLIAVLVFSFKKIKIHYWLYLFFSTLLILFSGVLSSIHRYILVMFPIYMFLGTSNKKYFYLICILSFIVLIYLSALFLRGYWVA